MTIYKSVLVKIKPIFENSLMIILFKNFFIYFNLFKLLKILELTLFGLFCIFKILSYR